MKCRQARLEMALHLKQDGVGKLQWERVRRHVSTCVECRAHYARLKEALSAIEQSETPSTYEIRGSLWPSLESRLSAPPPKAAGRIGGNWMPVLSVAVACLLFVSVWLSSPAPQDRPHGPPVGRNTIGGLTDWPEQEPRLSREAREADERARRSAAENPPPVESAEL